MTVPSGADMDNLGVGGCIGLRSDSTPYTLMVVGSNNGLTLEVLDGPFEADGRLWTDVWIIVNGGPGVGLGQVSVQAFVNTLLQQSNLQLEFMCEGVRERLPVDDGSVSWASDEHNRTFLEDN